MASALRTRFVLTALCLVATACGGSTPTTTGTGSMPDPGRPDPDPDAGTGTGPGTGAVVEPTGPQPPKAMTKDFAVHSPYGSRNDPYYWVRDDTRTNKDVLAYLEAENKYTAEVLGPSQALADTLFAEMRSRIKEDDADVPVLDEGYWYYTRYETGQQQPIYARRKGTMKAKEEVLLDGNKLAEGKSYFKIGGYDVSNNGRMLAWVDDSVGRRQYVLHVKDLRTGTVLPDSAENVATSLVWANDNKTVFYTGKDAVTLREDRVFRHALGAKDPDALVYKEDDGSYYVGVGGTKSHRYIQMWASATTNTEIRLVDANKPTAKPVVFLPRTKDHEYSIDHLDGRFVVRTNADAKNFRLITVADGKQADRAAWKDVIPHSPDKLVEDFAVFHGFIAATVRTGGLEKVEVVPAKKPAFFLDAQDPTYAMSIIDTPDPKAKAVRYAYASMVVPTSVFEANVATGARTLLKEQPVPGYDKTLYASEYLHAPAADGVLVPVSVVYKKTTPRDGTAPVFVYGYGSYGSSSDPRVSTSWVSLLDRGWVLAIAHIRGGEEMGRAWYEDGKLLKKKNTFTDFIAATEYLVGQKYGARDQVYAMGGSAGGLLMGAIVNLRPDLYRGVVATVPFVDVVTTMLDETIPLTTNEFDEWGNPAKDKASYEYMLSYSPYDNVKAQDYPSIYVHTGLWDSQVQYYEPTKWVAKLRATKTDRNLLVLDTDMTSGHGGASGRFDRLKQTAREMAFLLYIHDRPDARPSWPAR